LASEGVFVLCYTRVISTIRYVCYMKFNFFKKKEHGGSAPDSAKQEAEVSIKKEADFIYEQIGKYKEKLGEDSKEYKEFVGLGEGYLAAIHEHGMGSGEANAREKSFSRMCKMVAESRD